MEQRLVVKTPKRVDHVTGRPATKVQGWGYSNHESFLRRPGGFDGRPRRSTPDGARRPKWRPRSRADSRDRGQHRHGGRTAPSAAITGGVVDGATTSPVAGAVVYLSSDGRAIVGDQSRQITDDKGRFGFLNLPAGHRYTLHARPA